MILDNKSLPFVLLLFLFGLLSCGGMKKSEIEELGIVEELDIKRYLGTWYELARFPHSFEEGLVGVTATYRLKKNGDISVVNQGYKDSLDGKLSRRKAKAKIPNPDKPGRLKVYFIPFFGADYFVLELDQKDYSYALVGSSSYNYLWILGREPQMPDSTYNMLVKKAKERGYDTSKLIKVKQPRASD